MVHRTALRRHTARACLTVILGSVAATIGVSSPAAAQSELERAGARDAAQQGLQAFENADYATALDLFERAESVVHAPPHMLYIARSAAALGHLVRAREMYMRLKRETLTAQSPQAFLEAQQQADAELAKLEPRIPRLKLEISGAPNPEVTFDDQKLPSALVGLPTPVDPGSHLVTAQSANGARAEQVVQVEEGTTTTVRLLLVLPGPAPTEHEAAPDMKAAAISSPRDPGTTPRTSPLRLASYGAFGLGALGLGAGTYFIVRASGKTGDANALYDKNDCPGSTSCTPDVHDQVVDLDAQAKSSKTLSAVAFVTGGVGVATGVVLYVLAAKHTTAKSAWLTPYFGPTQVGLFGRY